MDINKLLIKFIIIFVGITLGLACQLNHPTPPVVMKELPNRVGYVNDFALILEEDTRKNLEIKLTEFKKNYNIEFIIVTVDSNGDRTPLEYSELIKDTWKLIPINNMDNKILFNFAKDNQDFRISMTFGLLDLLPNEKLEELAKILSNEEQNLSRDQALNNYVAAVIETITTKIDKQK